MIVLKICGMRSLEDVRTCVEAGVDALGFVFADGPHRLSLEEGSRMTAAAPAGVTRVGVFANQSRALVLQALGRCRLDVLQFAGDETPEFCGSFGVPTLLTARERPPAPDVVQRARSIGVIGDARVKGRFGGTGIRMAPDRARFIRDGLRVPFILAGGLTPDNVGDAMREVHPDGVDVSSGVERSGRKDPELVARFALRVKEVFHART
ncbi:MAG TPA: phosphoribosylanthranilate isomerase [Candidatus Eremiobacteraceae bacterium]|nr:phosphoribosylanthranilate isomerase [Candidatus Eremiobacteraceae bacterium]